MDDIPNNHQILLCVQQETIVFIKLIIKNGIILNSYLILSCNYIYIHFYITKTTTVIIYNTCDFT